MTDRIRLIYEEKLACVDRKEKYWTNIPRINMFAVPGFINMSFMQRKARMVEEVLSQVKVRIFDHELIVGSFLKTWMGVDYTTYEERRAFANMSFGFPRRNNREINGETVYSSSPLLVTDEELKTNVDRFASWSWGHACGGFERILKMGYWGIAEDAERRIAEMEASGTVDQEKKEFWEAVSCCCRAVCKLAERYAVALDELAAEEQDSTRLEELKQMAAMMRYVPARPARTFWEALQSVWFAFMCSVRFNGTDLGRFDQYMYPYCKKDIDEGRLTEEDAQELVDSFFLKCFEGYVAVAANNRGTHPAIMLAGLNADGKDGTNPLTFMCLRATEKFSSPTPKLSVRINEQTPKEIFEQAHRMLMKGLNQPDFYIDRTIIPAYQRLGVPIEDAVRYAQSTCEENSLAGVSEDCTNEGPHCDVHDKVELAMRRVAAGEAADTFEDFMKLVDEEIRTCLKEEIEYHVIQTEKLRRYSPQPLHSAGIVGCLESGKDITAGGAKYNNTGSVIGGVATAADGLYAINRLVYEERRMTLPEFHHILQNNYEGHELLRLEILHKFPKYGNDIPEVDQYAARLFDIFSDELERHTNSRGGKYKIGAWASEYRSSYPATPDGRRQGDTFATNISPTPGCDVKGATAILRSATRLNLRKCTAGGMIDVAITPSCLRGENGAELLRQLVMSYGDMGGVGLQFNILDPEALKDAKENPMKYRNLMVRVWGYNDYFVSLREEVQNHIISRTIQETL